jgi:uncharacterized protein DUF6801
MVILVPPKFRGHTYQGLGYMDNKNKFISRKISTVLAATIVLAAPAYAAPAQLALQYSCAFPLLKDQPMSVHISADIPESVVINTLTDEFAISADATVTKEAWNGLYFLGARSLYGSASANATLTLPQGNTLDLDVPMNIARTSLPNALSEFSVNAVGATPPIAFSSAGDASITVNNIVMQISPQDHNDKKTGVGTFESLCTLSPNQHNTLTTIHVITEDSEETALRMAGSMSIPTAKSTFDVSGSLTIDQAQGNAEILLNSAHAKLKSSRLFGAVTGSSDVIFSFSNPAAAEVANSTLTVTADMHVLLPNISVKLFGFTISTGATPDCKTQAPVHLTLASPNGHAFSPTQGGIVTGTYTLPSFSQCDGINGLVNLMMSGSENTLELSLKPATDAKREM